MYIAADVVLVDKNTNVLKGELELRREPKEKKRLKINKAKTELLECKFRNDVMGIILMYA